MNKAAARPRWGLAVLVTLTIAAFVAGGWMLAREAATRGEDLPPPIEFVDDDPPQPRWIPACIFAAVAAGLTAAVLMRIPRLTDHDSFALVTFGWIAAIAAWAVAVWFVSPPAPAGSSRDGGKRDWTTFWILAVIVTGAFALRVTSVGAIPFTVGGDEASQGLEAIKILNGELRNPFTTTWYSVPSMSFFFQAITIGPLGATTFALRLPWVLVGTASVLTTFFVVRRMAGRWTAVATALAVAAYHFHIHYSRLGSNQILDTLVVSSVLLYVYRALDGTRWRLFDWAAAGAVSALAFYWYAGARLAAIVAVAVVAYHFLREPKRLTRRQGAGLIVAVLSFMVVAAPILQYSVRFPNEFNGRINQVGIFQSGWLEREIEILDQSMGAILFDQFRRAALAFNYYPDRRVWYGLETPLLDPVFGAIFLLGLGYALAAVFILKRQRRLAPMVVWWWAGMLLGGMLTESPPSSQRLITLAIPACFFIVLALRRLLGAVRTAAIPSLPVDAAVVAVIGFFAATSAVFYFAHYTPQRIYGGQHAELATTIAPNLNALEHSHDVAFLGTPVMYWGFSTTRYLAPGIFGTEINEDLHQPPPSDWRRAGRGLIILILPHRLDELALVRETFPEGRLRPIRSEGSRHGLLAVEYTIPPAP